MTNEQLQTILKDHALCMKDATQGKKAKLVLENLTGAVLTGANLTGAILAGAVLTDADLAGAILTRAVLTGANLADAILTRAVLTGADLAYANLAGAKLTDANLADAILTRAVLTGAKLAGAILTGAKLAGATMPTPEQPSSLADAANRVATWLKKEGRWLQKNWIFTPTGAYANDCSACLHGAAVYMGGTFGPALSQRLIDAGYTATWNDAPGRTIDDVCAALEHISQNCEA